MSISYYVFVVKLCLNNLNLKKRFNYDWMDVLIAHPGSTKTKMCSYFFHCSKLKSKYLILGPCHIFEARV